MNKELDTKSTYGKGLLGRTKSVLDKNILPVVGGNFDGKVIRFEQFASLLPPYPYDSQSLTVEAARLNTRFPKVLEAMLFSGKRCLRDEAYIEAMGGMDFGNIAPIAMRTAALEQQDPKIVIRVVFGGTNQMPFRALSGFLPALVYMDHLQEDGIVVPQLQVIFTDHISSCINGHIDFKQAEQESGNFAKLATSYVGNFFPSLRGSVVVLRDTPVKDETVLGKELLEVSEIADQVVSDGTRQDLVAKGRNGNGQHNITYGAAHLLVHDMALPEVFVPIIDGQPTVIEPEAIISIGGRQERFFYKFRHEIKPYLPERYRRIITFQFFTRHQVPPYYMAENGDLLLADGGSYSKAIAEEKIGEAAKYDINYLLGVSQRRGDFLKFLS